MIVQDQITLPSFDALESLLLDMIKPLENPRMEQATWESVVSVLQEMEAGYFASSSGPDGSAWAPLSYYTRVKKGHAVILRETWELEKSVTKTGSASSVMISDGSHLEFGTNREWAWVHQDGSEKQNKEGKSAIPARPFIGMNEQGMTDVMDVVADAAVKMMFG